RPARLDGVQVGQQLPADRLPRPLPPLVQDALARDPVDPARPEQGCRVDVLDPYRVEVPRLDETGPDDLQTAGHHGEEVVQTLPALPALLRGGEAVHHPAVDLGTARRWMDFER